MMKGNKFLSKEHKNDENKMKYIKEKMFKNYQKEYFIFDCVLFQHQEQLNIVLFLIILNFQ